MHNIYRARIRTSRYDPNEFVEWHFDLRDDACAFATETVKSRRLRQEYVGRVEITPIEVPELETAYDYNYPYAVHISNRR